MVMLAALDFVGMGKEWAEGRNPPGRPAVLEPIRYAVELPDGKSAAIVAVLVLQAYLILILAPNGSSP